VYNCDKKLEHQLNARTLGQTRDDKNVASSGINTQADSIGDNTYTNINTTTSERRGGVGQWNMSSKTKPASINTNTTTTTTTSSNSNNYHNNYSNHHMPSNNSMTNLSNMSNIPPSPSWSLSSNNALQFLDNNPALESWAFGETMMFSLDNNNANDDTLNLLGDNFVFNSQQDAGEGGMRRNDSFMSNLSVDNYANGTSAHNPKRLKTDHPTPTINPSTNLPINNLNPSTIATAARADKGRNVMDQIQQHQNDLIKEQERLFEGVRAAGGGLH
jgi:hypothetical protein